MHGTIRPRLAIYHEHDGMMIRLGSFTGRHVTLTYVRPMTHCLNVVDKEGHPPLDWAQRAVIYLEDLW